MSVYTDKKADTKKKEATVVQDSAPEAEPVLEKVETAPVKEKIVEEVVPNKEEKSTVKGPKAVRGVVASFTGLNLRATPNTTSLILKVLEDKEEIVILSTDAALDWYRVSTKDGKIGYAMKKFVKLA